MESNQTKEFFIHECTEWTPNGKAVVTWKYQIGDGPTSKPYKTRGEAVYHGDKAKDAHMIKVLKEETK